METNTNPSAQNSGESRHIVGPSDRAFKVMTAAVTILGIFLAAELLYQFASLPQNQPHEIQVSGEGKAYLKPDVALVSFGVTSQAAKSQDAVNQNNTKMNAIIAAIKGLGVEGKDIQTTLYHLTPVYDYSYPVPMGAPVMDSARGSGGSSSSMIYPMPPVPGGRTFNGYSLEQQISVKIRNFDNINAVLDKAAAAGATNVGQLSFTVDNPEMARAEARKKAIEAAKEKIKAIAKESGLQVGKLVNVYEGYNNYPQPMYAEAMNKDAGAPSVPPQIQTGQMEISSSVTLTFQVK